MSVDLTNVIVTGASGMIGRRLVSILAGRGIHVTAVSRKEPTWDRHLSVTAVQADLVAEGGCEDVFDAAEHAGGAVQAVLHLAGMSGSAEARSRPEDAVRINIVLTGRLLDAVQRRGCHRFLLASTGAVYSNLGRMPAQEEDLPLPDSFYSATKLAAEAICQGAAREWGLSCEVARISNVYGPDSPENTVIGRLLGQARRGDPLEVAVSHPIRDFIHVDEVAEGLIRLLTASSGFGCRVTNLSTGVGTRVGEVVATTAAITSLPVQAGVSSGAGEPDVLVLSNRRLFELTGWRPSCTVEAGLKSLFLRQGNKI